MLARLTLLLALLGAGALLTAPVIVWAGNAASSCNHCGGHCEQCKMVPCQIMVPALVVEKRMKTCIIKEQVEREEKYTVFQKVPVTREIYKEYCCLIDDVKTKTITEKQCHLIPCPVEKTYLGVTYHPEIRDVCTKNCDGTCNTESCQVMVPVKEPFVKTWCEIRVGIETITKDIDYCVKVPQKEKVLCGVEETCEIRPIEKTRIVTVCVPRVVKTPEEVIVRKMIPKTIYCCPTCAKHHK